MGSATPAELLHRRHQANDVAKVTCEAAWHSTVRLLPSRCATRGKSPFIPPFTAWAEQEGNLPAHRAPASVFATQPGNTLEFLLSATRDAEAAKRFFVKALHSTAGSAPGARPIEEQVAQPTALADPNTTKPAPRVINVDKNAASPKAMAELKAAGILPKQVELRQVNSLNNLIEQDHRFIKRLVKPGMGFFSLETAGRTLQGYEVMNMIRKRQVRGVSKGDLKGQVSFIASLFGVAT